MKNIGSPALTSLENLMLPGPPGGPGALYNLKYLEKNEFTNDSKWMKNIGSPALTSLEYLMLPGPPGYGSWDNVF